MAVSGSKFKARVNGSCGAAPRYGASFNIKKAANNNSPDREIINCLKTHLEKIKSGKPRKADKRLWESLSDDQFRAAQQIYFGFKMRVAGTGLRTQVFSCMPPAAFVRNDGPSDLLEKFAHWSRQVHGAGISVGAVLDILVFGKSCREVDRDQRKRKGFAKKNLVAGLAVFADLHIKNTI